MTPRTLLHEHGATGAGWTTDLDAFALALPAVLDNLRSSYGELEERAARIERELLESNRQLSLANQARSALAERLHAADKLSALGTMAAGIAHEIRNPLNAVRGFAELLARRELARPDADARTSQWAQRIVDGVGEIDGIIENLLSFGSPERLRLERVDGQELLEDAARLAGSLLEAAPSIEVSSAAPTFRADRIKLRQAVRNLIENALEAQAGCARARVLVTLAREGPELVCRVADAGPGVAPELRTQILDPFFTTHADGTGLGLALVSVIARLHGGSVHCAPDPSPLGGALFVLRVSFQPADEPAVLPT
ncbi:MAG: hypothetical protein EXS08_11415 [Planctomycetes bacterium]|nr:hypothetical protein [Planctomycetota bacterium]